MEILKTTLKYLSALLVVAVIVVLGFYLYLISQTTRQGDITWQSCYRPAYLSWFVLPPPIHLQCTTMSVPVDYSKPDGKNFIIPLTRLPSKNPNVIGDLLLLNGGPGGHSLDMATFMMVDKYGQTLGDNFHLLGYAPRGVTPSNPAISCGDLEESDDAQSYMVSCVEHTGEDVLPFISSKEVVRDLDKIRQKLGNEMWSMLSYSYGTKLVAKYAEHYPKYLRAGVLDGVVDTSEDLITILINQNKGLQMAFDGFMKHCPNSCIFNGNKDPSQAFIDKLNDIEQKKLTDKNGDIIDGESILNILSENLIDEYYWQDLHVMMSELNEGNTQTYNAQKLIFELNEKTFSEDALALVNCADSAPNLSKEDYIKHTKYIDTLVRFDDIKPKSDNDYLDACYYWAWEATDDLHENLINDDTPKLLFVAQKYDFATPFANAKTMANRFNDGLIYTPNYGHTVSLSGVNACVDDYVVRYLINPKADFGEQYILCQ